MLKTELLDRLIGYIEIAHHIKGRLRLRFDEAILNEFSKEQLESLIELKDSIIGVLDVRINKLAKSAIIEYDPNVIVPHIWEALVLEEKKDEALAFLGSLKKE